MPTASMLTILGVGYRTQRGSVTEKLELSTLWQQPMQVDATIYVENEGQRNWLLMVANRPPISVTLPDGTAIPNALVIVSEWPGVVLPAWVSVSITQVVV